MTPLLSACLIVKDEEIDLPACLDALRVRGSAIDEICVYDTGSTDRTVEIAEAAGARVVQGYWDDDFSRARNEALGMAKGKWALVVDADERIVADHAALMAELRRGLTDQMTGVDMYRVPVINVNEAGRPTTSYPSPRILRLGRILYERAIHEEPRLQRAGRAVRLEDLDASMVAVRHHGYASHAEIVSRGDRNLAAADADAPLDDLSAADKVKALVDRARSLELTGDWEQALALDTQAWEAPVETLYRLWAAENAAEICIRTGQPENAAWWVRQARSAGLEAGFADWLLAKARNRQGRHEEARRLLLALEAPRNSVGVLVEPVGVIEELFIAEAKLRHYDEARAYAVQLIAGYGLPGYASVLLRMWGMRPIGDLVELLSFADKGHLGAFVDELRSTPNLPQGAAALADALEARDRRGGGRVSAEVGGPTRRPSSPAPRPGEVRAASTGAAFGL